MTKQILFAGHLEGKLPTIEDELNMQQETTSERFNNSYPPETSLVVLTQTQKFIKRYGENYLRGLR